MRSHFLVFALTTILVLSIGVSSTFALEELIVVTTDKTSYAEGDTVIVSGEVREILTGFPVTLQVIAANGNLVTIEQLQVGADRMFSTTLSADGPLWSSQGTYTIKVQHGTDARTAETTFEFGGTTGTGTTPTFGQSLTEGEFGLTYQITGGSVVSIIPDVDQSSLIIVIEASDDGELTITLPREIIDAKIGDADDDFFVLVDAEEVDFDEIVTETDRTLTIGFLAGTEEIEIIGTFVIPEFGTIAALILAVAIISIIVVSAKTRLSIMPKY
ncbi:MAG: PEFG-CTERM sorting domain-containing protein [Nitrosopumilales archaeon]|nr:MAG: PEFG-CTERM sorting domain-containing protein [Nitrosopumilales archaeon]